jgi:hypothetical protein
MDVSIPVKDRAGGSIPWNISFCSLKLGTQTHSKNFYGVIIGLWKLQCDASWKIRLLQCRRVHWHARYSRGHMYTRETFVMMINSAFGSRV